MIQTNFRAGWWAYSAPYLAVLIGLYLIGNAWIAALLYHALMLLFLRHRERRSCSLLSGWRPGLGIILTLVCACSGLFLYLLWPAAGLADHDLRTTLTDLGLGGIWLWVFCLYFSTAGVLLEELFWRDSPAGGGSPLDAAFAGYHALVLVFFIKLVWVAAILMILFAMGRIWRIIASRTGGLAIPVISHSVADLSVVVALFLLLNT
jgi:membrane protease YdiL (CAAX protease family)